ncbi:MAG: tetratricopeptide repeat protein [Desulfobacteraceae bacterium]
MTTKDKIAQFLSDIEAGREFFREGVSQVEAGNYAAGITALQEALRRSPNFPQAYAWLGYACLERALKAEPAWAAEFFDQALESAGQALDFELCPQNACALAHCVLGLVHLKAYNDRNYALKKYELVRQLNQKFARLLKDRINQNPLSQTP